MANTQGINNYNKNIQGETYKKETDNDGNTRATIDKEPLTDNELLSTLNQAVNDTDDWNTSNLSAQRVNSYNMYYGSSPVQRTIGRSTYVSLDVLDVTETLKASVLNVFAGARNPVTFEPYSVNDTEEVEQASMAMDYILNNQNNQYDIHSSVTFDGLLTKIGVVKVYHEQVEQQTDFPFYGTREQLDVLLGENESFELKDERNVEDVEQREPNEQGQMVISDVEYVEAVITEYSTKDQIKVDTLPPEEFLVDEKANCVEDATFTCHQRDVTVGELREMGFDEDLIEQVGVGDLYGQMSTDYERVARNQYDNKGSFSTNVPVADESMAFVTLYESYLIADYDGDGYPYMCQVFHADDIVLEKTRVDVNPFHAFVPFPISHKLHGQSVADRIGGVQIYKTQLERAILDNTELNNNTRYIADIKQLDDPRELTNTRFGGVVRSKGDPRAAVFPLPKPDLSPMTFQALKILEDEKQQRTGVNKMTQGLSEDALKPGNSGAKVGEIISVSFQRQKIVARQYASFWKKVYEHVYQLSVAYMPFLEVPNADGEPIMLRPNSWRSTRTATVNDALAFGESEQKAQQLIQIDQVLSNDQKAEAMYSQEDKFRLWNQVFENLGYPQSYVSQPDPNKMTAAQQQQLQIQQQQLQQQQRTNDLAEKQLELQLMDRRLTNKKIMLDANNKKQQMVLDTDKFEVDTRNKGDINEISRDNLELDARYKAELLRLEEMELELDKQKLAIEAMLEAKQGRGVAIG